MNLRKPLYYKLIQYSIKYSLGNNHKNSQYLHFHKFKEKQQDCGNLSNNVATIFPSMFNGLSF